jgi:hypothetical protein
MIRTIKTRVHKARKMFRDDIYPDFKSWYDSGCWSDDCKKQATAEEKDIAAAYLRRDMPWVIKPGEAYVSHACTDGVKLWTFRMLDLISTIVHKYKIGYED